MKTSTNKCCSIVCNFLNCYHPWKFTWKCVSLTKAVSKEDEQDVSVKNLDCKIMAFHEGYKRWMPPITLIRETIRPAPVKISLTILRVISIKEGDLSIKLQFQINLEWKDYRLTYYNLKTDLHLNTLSSQQMKSLWLPIVIYKNTEQLESTRLGVDWEWTTNIWVRRENPIRLGYSWLDETEIFNGSENSLVMVQSYTHEFQCSFKLQHYPFDTQVNLNFDSFGPFPSM